MKKTEQRKRLEAELKALNGKICTLEKDLQGLNRKKSQLEMVLSHIP